MPELDIDASAREVADLLNQGQIRQAAERLETLRRDQALVVQESLDRLVAVRARDRLNAPGTIAADEHVGPVVERLRTATAPPRFPAETETRNLSQAQLHDVYGSMVESRGNQVARLAGHEQRARDPWTSQRDQHYLSPRNGRLQ